MQREERARRMLWCRADWRASVADIIFEHQYLGGRPIEFSGDLRPAMMAPHVPAWSSAALSGPPCM